MSEFRFPATSQNGKIEVELAYLPKLAEVIEVLNGKAFILVLETEKKRRSNPQNRYYRGVVVKMIASELGWEEDEVHIAMKHKFLVVEDDGDLRIERIASTKDLSTVEFEEYIEKIRRWAAEFLNIYIPNPNCPEDYYYGDSNEPRS